MSKGLFTPRMIAIKENYITDNIILFIHSTCFKCSSSLQQDGFRLAVNVFILLQLDKIILKVIPISILFLCAIYVIAVV